MSSTDLTPAAREQTPEERQERVDVCFALNERIKEAILEGRKALWDLSQALYEFDQQEGWRPLGFESQTEWLAQPEIGMTRTAYFRLIRRHKELVIRRKLEVARLAQLEPSKVDIVLPYIEDGKVRVKTALNDAEALGARDLREKYVKPSSVRQAEPPPDAIDQIAEGGAGEPDDFDEQVPPIIEGNGTVITDEHAESGIPSETPSGEVDGEARFVESDPELARAAALVEQWLEVGGDQADAQNGWDQLTRTHPIFYAISVIGACVAGGEGAPDRDEGLEAWELVREALRLEVGQAA